jgi:hypothetical protein
MEKQPAETNSTAPNDRPASMSETIVSKEPKNPQLDVPDVDHSPVNSAVVNESEVQYVTGVRLAVIISTVTLTAFLIMLDVSIIATVSRLLWPARPVMRTDSFKRQLLKSRANFILFRMLVGTGVLIC